MRLVPPAVDLSFVISHWSFVIEKKEREQAALPNTETFDLEGQIQSSTVMTNEKCEMTNDKSAAGGTDLIYI